MVVATVDQRDADRRARKPKRRFQPAEPAPTITTRWGCADRACASVM